MKHALTLLGLMACMGTGAALAAPDASSSIPSSLLQTVASQAAGGTRTATSAQQFTLKNGMQLIVQPDRRAPTAVHMVWVRVGSVDEVDGTSGVAHALEHMMFKGSRKVAPGEFSRRVAALGGQENAFTSRDYTGYYQQIPSSRLEDVMKLESDRFANNHWPDSEFKKEIEVIKEERRMRTEDQPRAVLMEQLMAATFVASPYHRPVIGWMSDLDALTPGDVRDFHGRWYVPGNATIVIAGDVDVAKVRAWAEKYYGSIPARALPVRKPRTEPAQIGIRRIEVKQPAEQALVALAFRAPSLTRVSDLQADDRDALALLVLSAVLDGYDGARLERALVQGEGRVADGAGSSMSLMGRGPGLFMLTGVPATGKTAAEVEAALRAEVAKVAKDGVEPAELERVKTQWMASNVYERDSVMGQAQSLGNYWIQGMPLDAEDQLLTQLRTITPDDVKRVAAKYFGDDQLTVGTLVPQPLPEGGKPRRPDAGAAIGGPLH
ncbi:peptidase M16 domain protein [Delftia acidovorans SPH-1]|uniref:Peptidase M16 domain protein n=2 Tax=cellular organisms TaxID=131567 RepID=A9BUY0_DELAS|nr:MULTISPECIES: pitrilysin family protein [Delftia]ABX34442.1 peptidase M16 domain protein [Delftia acidovorans SPH-1]OLE06188.1 MAG: peptidase M16 [Delftia sp. 13_1_20CM_4_67_18]OLE92930.1 MAG: peptidase M16 [Delftia sp. 13_1_40CM_3_66_6]QPS76194.1 insulinase family protein [Delftia acidovorans]